MYAHLGGDVWSWRQKLMASDAYGGEFLGFSVSMDGGLLVAGAYSDGAPCGQGGCDAGSAYVFRHEDPGTPDNPMDDVWIEEAKLVAPNPGPDDHFGFSVSVCGDWIVAGAPINQHLSASGAAYMYYRNDPGTPSDPLDDTWVLHTKLSSPGAAANPDDHFGWSVAIWQERIVVSAPFPCDFGAHRGTVYVFRRNDPGTPLDVTDDVWALEATLSPKIELPTYCFGHSVEMTQDLIAVGASDDSTAGGVAPGAVFVYRLDEGGTQGDASDDAWRFEAQLIGSDTPSQWGVDQLGWSVSISGDRIVAGAPDHDPGQGFVQGAAYVFRYAGGQWHEEQKLMDSDTLDGQFGESVAIEGYTVFVGDEDDSEAGSFAGAAYQFRVADDCNGDCVSDADELAAGAPDCNNNNVPDYCDLDCNNNSIPDECDLMAGTSPDCDANGVPDECDPDCNGNDVPDGCDVSAGTSPDCNSNGVPDECDTDDCNANGVPDSCDLAAESSPDCNTNGTPDECDVASGFSRDCTADGIPDECTAVCVDSCECHDDNPCTFDVCLAGTCVNIPRDYGDVDNNGTITLADLFCVLDGFAGEFTTCTFGDVDVEPCAGNGVITLADLFAVLDAYAGDDPCCGG